MKFSDSGVRPQGKDPGQEDGSKRGSVSAGNDDPGRLLCDDVVASCHVSPRYAWFCLYCSTAVA
ncbi:hypothetical protein Paes_0018 [Prosthecochloris aestuarii DSM 271]|uniref:Uncharacterized protein n=1 Tax=Prosthecochloris aestuarii (strain DSM 271 / SK 413) TaxID=290512 RepID=B4S952_PROA2|nr:hypothetical protein Paes_0018 [Prosthecochloris aestuarii DSM 271]